MGTEVVVERVRRAAATCGEPDPGGAPLRTALDDVARIESWAAARRAEIVRAMVERPGSFPEADVAETTGCSLGAGDE